MPRLSLEARLTTETNEGPSGCVVWKRAKGACLSLSLSPLSRANGAVVVIFPPKISNSHQESESLKFSFSSFFKILLRHFDASLQVAERLRAAEVKTRLFRDLE